MAEPQMSREAADATTLLNRMAFELSQREKPIRRRLDYYRGRHQLSYASPEFRGYFGERFAGFSDNWCEPVVNSPAERMNVLGVRLDPDEDGDPDDLDVDKELDRVWRSNSAEAGSSEAFVVGLAAGWSYALVWGDPEDEETPRITWQRPDQAIVVHDPETGRRTAGMLMWRDDLHEYATLYTPDWVWKYRRNTLQDGRLRSGLVLPSTAIGGWEPRQPASDDTWPLPNPMGLTPLIEMRNRTLMDDEPISDIDGVMAMQDAINLIWAYLVNALDYASLPQRIVMGTDIPQVPVLDKVTGLKIGTRPVELDELIRDRLLWIPGDNVKTAEWTAANLDAYSHVIERAIEHIAAQTRTPPHYLIGKVANLSAEALTAAETGLVSKTSERITYFTPGIRELFRLVALAQFEPEKAKAVRRGTVVWSDIQFRALAQKVDALHKLSQMGFPFEWIAEQFGCTPNEVRRLMRMRERDAALDPLTSALQPKALPMPAEDVDEAA